MSFPLFQTQLYEISLIHREVEKTVSYIVKFKAYGKAFLLQSSKGASCGLHFTDTKHFKFKYESILSYANGTIWRKRGMHSHLLLIIVGTGSFKKVRYIQQVCKDLNLLVRSSQFLTVQPNLYPFWSTVLQERNNCLARQSLITEPMKSLCWKGPLRAI